MDDQDSGYAYEYSRNVVCHDLCQPDGAWYVWTGVFPDPDQMAGDARILRSHMLSLVYAEYIQAARCTGCNFFWIFRRHVLPNTTFLIFTLFGLDLPAVF